MEETITVKVTVKFRDYEDWTAKTGKTLTKELQEYADALLKGFREGAE